MVKLLLLLSLLGGDGKIGISLIARSNRLLAEADSAVARKDYTKAATKYGYLVDSMGFSDETALMNLANACFLTKKYNKAADCYTSLTKSGNNTIASQAWQQLGVLAQGNREEAVSCFRKALKADPNNEAARRNYELMKQQLNTERKENKEQKNKEGKEQEKGKEDKKEPQNEKQPGQGDKQDKAGTPPSGKPGDKKGKEPGKPDKTDIGAQDNKPGADKQAGKEKGGNEQGHKAPDQNPQGEGQGKGEKGKQVPDGKPAQEGGKEADQKPGNEGNKNQEAGAASQNLLAKPGAKDAQGRMVNVFNRQRLQKMNLTEEKAQKLLDDMKSNEQQYLQQRQRPASSSSEGRVGKPAY